MFLISVDYEIKAKMFIFPFFRALNPMDIIQTEEMNPLQRALQLHRKMMICTAKALVSCLS
jgi:hypothetical protein